MAELTTKLLSNGFCQKTDRHKVSSGSKLKILTRTEIQPTKMARRQASKAKAKEFTGDTSMLGPSLSHVAALQSSPQSTFMGCWVFELVL